MKISKTLTNLAYRDITIFKVVGVNSRSTATYEIWIFVHRSYGFTMDLP